MYLYNRQRPSEQQETELIYKFLEYITLEFTEIDEIGGIL